MSSDDYINYYQILDVQQNTEYAEIKLSFMKKIKANHPDKAGDSKKEFAMILIEAWKVLRDEDSRNQFDLLLEERKNGKEVFFNRNALDVIIEGDKVECPQCGEVNILPWDILETGGMIDCCGCSSY